MFRPTKRQRIENPPSWLDCQSLSTIASPFGENPIRTTVVSEFTKELVLDRFNKEILTRYNFSLSSQLRVDNDVSLHDMLECRKILQSRILVGVNRCTTALEQACYRGGMKSILLIVSGDVEPPTMLSHIPVLAHQTHTPVLLLPGPASNDLGRLLGTKRVALVCFLAHDGDTPMVALEQGVHQAVDSFVAFAVSKIQGEKEYTLES